jgi:cytochrome c oxidase subunit III
MATTLSPPKPAAPPNNGGFDGHGYGSGGNGFGGFDGSPRGEFSDGAVLRRLYLTGIWLTIAGIAMLFAAFTSAMIVRQGISSDWVPTQLPGILYFNTILLLASSLTLELARQSLAADRGVQFTRWLYGTVALGLGFVAGQLLAWQELVSRGVYLSTNPSSSFFYLLTAAHGIHLLGGIAALCYLVFHSRRLALKLKSHAAVDATAAYWHFMDGLWLYILVLLVTRL